jgi:predicted ATPase
LSQFDLSERSGVSVRTISDLERGRRGAPHAASARLLADALGLGTGQRDLFFEAANQGRRFASVAGADQDDVRSRSPQDGPNAILGRAAELATIERRLAEGDRLLTLLGPGGVGKSRLARAAADLRIASGRGAVWVALDAITDPALVLPTIARAVGIASPDEQHLAGTIAQALGDDPPLLVLDNMEHLIEASTAIAGLLAAAPGVQALTTSREALRLADERVLQVQPLPVPDSRGSRTTLADNPAVVLFLRALAAASPERGAGANDAADAAAIVRLVDGLPLAIELAAAQGVTLPLSSISTLLESRGLAALARGRRDGPARFQTMEAAIGWSADLLPAPAQRLFRLLGAFRGSFSAEAVLDAASRLGEPELLASLPALAETQLLQPMPHQPGRLHLLEPVRMFALDQLRASSEGHAIRRAHADHYLAWAQEQAPRVAGPDPMAALDALDHDLPNVLAAVTTVCNPATADVEQALRTTAALCQYWEVRSRFREGRSALAAAIAAAGPDAPPSESLMEAIFYSGYLAYLQSDLPAVRQAGRQLAPLADASGSPGHRVRTIILDVMVGDLSRVPAAEMLPPLRAAHDELTARGMDQMSSWQQSLLISANLMVEIGDVEGALPLLRAYDEWAARRGEAIHARAARHWLALALLTIGNYDEARPLLIASLEGSEETRLMIPINMTIFGLAIANSGPEAGLRRLARAARLHGAFDEMVARHSFGLTMAQETLRSGSRARLADVLGKERFEDLVADGRTLGTDALLDLARG